MSAARILPREEWGRLPDDAVALYNTLRPEDVAVLVVEDAGEIVARMAVMRAIHWESFWMAPDAVGNAGITRALLRAAGQKASEWGKWLYANASVDDDGVRQALERLGGQWMPMHTFLLFPQRIESEDVCRKP